MYLHRFLVNFVWSPTEFVQSRVGILPVDHDNVSTTPGRNHLNIKKAKVYCTTPETTVLRLWSVIDLKCSNLRLLIQSGQILPKVTSHQTAEFSCLVVRPKVSCCKLKQDQISKYLQTRWLNWQFHLNCFVFLYQISLLYLFFVAMDTWIERSVVVPTGKHLPSMTVHESILYSLLFPKFTQLILQNGNVGNINANWADTKTIHPNSKRTEMSSLFKLKNYVLNSRGQVYKLRQTVHENHASASPSWQMFARV